MATNLDLDPELLNRALAVGGAASKRETVTLALREFIAAREQAAIADLFGAIDWDEDYDHKVERQRR